MYGGLSGVADEITKMSFADAKAWISGAGGVGVPYDGTAQTAADIANVWTTLVPIANGDVSAMVANLGNPDPYIARIAAAYLKRTLEQSNPEQIVNQYQIDDATYRQLTGRSLVDESWWRARRESQILAAVFPYMGGRGGVIQGSDQRIHVVYGGPVLGPDQSVYDPNYDFGALALAAKQWADANPGGAPSPEAVARTQAAAAPPVPSGPPSGWHFNGKDGWWGPDGKFYAGDANATPWSGGTPGVSVDTYKQEPPPPPPVTTGGAAAGGAEPEPSPSAPPTPQPMMPPSAPLLAPRSVPYTGAPAIDMAPAEDTSVEGAAPASAGLGGGMGVLLGIVGALVMAGKHKRT